MVLDWGLTPGPPALDASTLPLGYREGGDVIVNHQGLNTLIASSECKRLMWACALPVVANIIHFSSCAFNGCTSLSHISVLLH